MLEIAIGLVRDNGKCPATLGLFEACGEQQSRMVLLGSLYVRGELLYGRSARSAKNLGTCSCCAAAC